eukprot:1095635-Pelagomonas_calceolata.AAC.1
MDVPLFWEELTRMTDLGRRWSGCGWRCALCSAHAPLYFSMDTGSWSFALFLLEQLKWHRVTGSDLCLSGKR